MDVPSTPTSEIFGFCNSLPTAEMKVLFFSTSRPEEREDPLFDPVEKTCWDTFQGHPIHRLALKDIFNENIATT